MLNRRENEALRYPIQQQSRTGLSSTGFVIGCIEDCEEIVNPVTWKFDKLFVSRLPEVKSVNVVSSSLILMQIYLSEGFQYSIPSQ